MSQSPDDPKTRDLPAGLRLVDGGVTAAPGFRAGNTACGIKSEPGAPDMALLLADRECDVAATFTTSQTASHTIAVCRDHLQRSRHRAQAVIINSGNANCSNGARGLDDAIRMTALAAARLGLDPTKVLVSSTGIIGRPLPMDKIERGIAQIAARPDGGHDFARGIMTTDTRPKTVAVEFDVQGKTVRLGGSTKGVGMIYPNMATMLCYLTTDAAVAPDELQAVMKRAVDDSFNMVCVDGDMSTNDSAFLFASGGAANEPLRAGSPGADVFEAALRYVTRTLGREMARDGEGAKKLMTVRVRGGATDADARRAARAITNSDIWKCAVAGGDPNWGRIISTLGASGASLDHDRLEIGIGGVTLVKDGVAANYDQAAAKRAMAGDEVEIDIHLHLGNHEATAWGCDLTYGYIDENATYTR